MPPRYKPIDTLTASQRKRITKITSELLIKRAVLPAWGVWALSLFLMVELTQVFFPKHNVEDWRFIVPVLVISTGLACISFFLFQIGMIRNLIRYREKRLGRV